MCRQKNKRKRRTDAATTKGYLVVSIAAELGNSKVMTSIRESMDHCQGIKLTISSVDNSPRSAGLGLRCCVHSRVSAETDRPLDDRLGQNSIAPQCSLLRSQLPSGDDRRPDFRCLFPRQFFLARKRCPASSTRPGADVYFLRGVTDQLRWCEIAWSTSSSWLGESNRRTTRFVAGINVPSYALMLRCCCMSSMR